MERMKSSGAKRITQAPYAHLVFRVVRCSISLRERGRQQMQNRLLALILMFAAVSVTFADVSAANAEGYSLVESVDTSSCADFAKLPVLEIVLAPELLPGESVSTSELMGVRETIMRRLNALGVNSAIVEIEASQDIVIDLFMTD